MTAHDASGRAPEADRARRIVDLLGVVGTILVPAVLIVVTGAGIVAIATEGSLLWRIPIGGLVGAGAMIIIAGTAMIGAAATARAGGRAARLAAGSCSAAAAVIASLIFLAEAAAIDGWSTGTAAAALRVASGLICIALLIVVDETLARRAPTSAAVAQLTRAARLFGALGATAMLLLVILIGTDRFMPGADRYFGWIVAAGIFGWIACAAAARSANRRAAADRTARDTISPSAKLLLGCPKCSAALSLPQGVHVCPHCRFALRVAFEEPRCLCGYALYRITGATCPECGRPVAGG
ncbi:MAG TPA: hypothetical protein PKC43_01935 [Phycisphaerales bacterium]|nr:hypothetical protein [Phycisphaerales bacterium]HMP36185.1 hypothetical protein [Phycisphaerales bacterium]